MDDSHVLLERTGAVATIVLNRPSSLNAVDLELAQQLADVSELVERDDSIRCVVLRGAGEHFMAGGDIRYFQSLLALPDEERKTKLCALIYKANQVVTRLSSMTKPVIASVQGSVAGFGLSLFCSCDLAIAADNASFMLSYCELGTSPDGGGTFMLPRLLGIRRAMGLALLGDRLDARQAIEANLVNRVVSSDALVEETCRLAAKLSAQPTQALGNTKRLLNASLGNDLTTQLRSERDSFIALARSQDFTEGVNAFIGKRRPDFRGC